MKAPDSFWQPARACSSLEVSMAGSAAGEAASFWMAAAARGPAGEWSATVASRPRSLFSSTWPPADRTSAFTRTASVSYTHLRAHETPEHLVCRLLLEKKNI